MSANGTSEMITINLDGREVEVPKGMNAIEAAKLHGKEIPHYCYHPKLSIAGNCRMCLIEMGMPMRDRGTGEPVLDEQGVQKIGWGPKPVIGCATDVSPGMHLRTDSESVKEARNGVTEFLLINHPLDCPICDQAGECRLQEFSADHGRGYSRFIEDKNVKPKRTVLGPRVTLDDERCILCSRCVRFSQEVAKDDVLGFVDRGTYSTLTCYPGKELANNYSLNTVDICPVGALTSTDFRFKMRVWFLKRTNSICTESSVGANTTVWSREGKIYRITPRRNDAVNDTWMTDSGRDLFKPFESDDRLTHYTVDGVHQSPEIAAKAAAELLRAGSVAVVGSAHSTVEEQFILEEIAKKTGASVSMVKHEGEGDGILLSEDRSPNLRGALLNGLISELPKGDLTLLAAQVDSGAVKTLLVVNEDLTQLGLTEAQLGQVKIIYLGAFANAVSQVAQVVLPSLSVFEKSGSFVNQNFRLQKFAAAVPGPRGLIAELGVLAMVEALLGEGNSQAPTIAQVWERIGQTEGVFAGLAWQKIPEEGLKLEAGSLAKLNFVESKNLKLDPAALEAAQALPA
ncbi:MAG: 2Fe-2S iron-sulfur cluster binding domain-containing protein [Verrucomicrobia bacterium]|nr:2Fe-2S iron-sulfur cluster binding domain-containing protein [Verrucomicrobiota bacterium]